MAGDGKWLLVIIVKPNAVNQLGAFISVASVDAGCGGPPAMVSFAKLVVV